MKERVVSLVGALALVGVAHGAAFTNGSFEFGTDPGAFTTHFPASTGITGWTVTGHSVDYIGTYWQAAEGSRSIDLNGGGQGGIEQTFDTVLSQVYTVTFRMAGNPDGPPQVKTLVASAGAFSGSFQADSFTKAAMGYVTHTFNFTATGTSTTLGFASSDTGSFGAALDNVTVTPVPEPFTMALAGGALVAAAARRRRQRA